MRKAQYDEYDPIAEYYSNNAPVVRRHPKRQRRPTLASVTKEAEKAGIQGASYRVNPDGSINIITGPAPVISYDDTQARDANVVAKERIEQMRMARHG
jgi:hypothetical protein